MPSNDFNSWSLQTKITKKLRKTDLTTTSLHSERCKMSYSLVTVMKMPLWLERALNSPSVQTLHSRAEGRWINKFNSMTLKSHRCTKGSWWLERVAIKAAFTRVKWDKQSTSQAVRLTSVVSNSRERLAWDTINKALKDSHIINTNQHSCMENRPGHVNLIICMQWHHHLINGMCWQDVSLALISH